MYRVVLKKTMYFQKGAKRGIQRYLSQYMDEVKKSALRNKGERHLKPQETEERLLLPDETTGQLWTGGFLGHTKSPTHLQSNKQKSWLKKTVQHWNHLLQIYPQRRTDGFRFVLSLAPLSVQHLTQSGHSSDQALREIWRKTLELYKKQHNWNSPNDQLGWISGAHHDTDNIHLHILLFPTTLSGKLLRTNNRRGPSKENDLSNLIALANIAAEVYWRENLPPSLQSPDYQKYIEQHPTEEPPLPPLESFPNTTRPNTQTPEKNPDLGPQLSIPNWAPSLLTPNETLEINLETGQQTLLQSIKNSTQSSPEIQTLKHTLTTYEVWSEKKIPLWSLKKQINTNANHTLKLQTQLPEETQALLSLQTLIPQITHTKTKSRLQTLLKPPQLGHALIALSTGLKEPPSPEETLQGLHKIAATYEISINDKTPKTKLQAIHKEGDWARNEKKQEQLRTHLYKSLLRRIRLLETTGIPTQNAIKILETLIQGSQTLTNALQARAQEAHHATKRLPDNSIEYHTTQREWTLNPSTNTFEIQNSLGKPWPPHLDPDLTFSLLKKPQDTSKPSPTPKKTSLQSIADSLSHPLEDNQNKTLSPLAQFIKAKWLRKRKLSKAIALELEKNKELETSMEIEPPTP